MFNIVFIFNILFNSITNFALLQAGWTPLLYAVASNKCSVQVVESLIKANSDVNRKYPVSTYQGLVITLHISCVLKPVMEITKWQKNWNIQWKTQNYVPFTNQTTLTLQFAFIINKLCKNIAKITNFEYFMIYPMMLLNHLFMIAKALWVKMPVHIAVHSFTWIKRSFALELFIVHTAYLVCELSKKTNKKPSIIM